MSRTEIKYSKQLVLFLDVLGTRANCDEKLLNTLHQAYRNAIYDVHFDNQFQNSDNLKISIFSDNVAIANNCENYDLKQKRTALHNMIHFANTIQTDLLLEGYLSRGGIAYGDCFIDDVMIMGTALIEAYHLESKEAQFPRVLVSESLIQEFNFLDHREDFLTMDTDGKYYADYIKLESQKDDHIIKRDYDFIQNNIGNLDIADKYIWLKEKLDNYLKLGKQNERL